MPFPAVKRKKGRLCGLTDRLLAPASLAAPRIAAQMEVSHALDAPLPSKWHKKSACSGEGRCIRQQDRAVKPGHGFCRDMGRLPNIALSCKLFSTMLPPVYFPVYRLASRPLLPVEAPFVLHRFVPVALADTAKIAAAVVAVAVGCSGLRFALRFHDISCKFLGSFSSVVCPPEILRFRRAFCFSRSHTIPIQQKTP